MERVVGKARLTLVQGDITRQKVDVIVNAANPGLMGGGGVDGAIHAAGGPAILEECKAIVARQGSLPAGQAVLTTGGRLPARYIIHTVGPVWRGGDQGEPETLASAYRESLRLAVSRGLKTVAFSSISTGVYGYPVELAARVCLQEAARFLREEGGVEEVRMVLFSSGTMRAFQQALEELMPSPQRWEAPTFVWHVVSLTIVSPTGEARGDEAPRKSVRGRAGRRIDRGRCAILRNGT
ncbi:MAG: O-acetyl-ADP-ribose deacetylase [Dehalococcoidia bacterium]|nr:O-acetyl-ADP-ribose deacetylase [Dehalococcoidia bacterium]